MLDPGPNLVPEQECITVTIPVPLRQKAAVPSGFVFKKYRGNELFLNLFGTGTKSGSRTPTHAGKN